MRDTLPFEKKYLDAVIESAENIVFVKDNLHFSELYEIINTEFSSTGKLLRPTLVIVSSLICGRKIDETVLKAAALTELVHMSSLIHDDIVDDALFRRGRSSVQSKYGKDMAVYAGDFILSRIMKSLFESDMRIVGDVFSATMEKMCVGEIGQKSVQFCLDTDVDTYINNINGKTAALFSLSCKIGAILSGSTADSINSLASFGRNLGILFQLRDDLIDIVPTMQNEGKSVNSDFKNGIYTMPVLYAVENGARDKVEELMKTEKEGTHLYDLLKECGALDFTVSYMKKCAENAKSALATFPESEAKTFMSGMPDFLMEFEL